MATDLLKICEKLGYSATLTIKEEYGAISILRSGMKKFFEDYKLAVHKCPQLNLGKIETKIKNSFKIYNRPIYKTKGNKEHILQLIKNEDLTVNQIALRINMTRQGVRFHINNLEKEHLIFRSGETGEKNIVYRYGDVLHVNRIGR
ncbi:winged helix-turn-helix transcriptional regulator [Candidatus Micrarchaeota archaeon]|nr:winged helix-turn-helix transcriptional regulator [Candidatus Micrarchaeota archaeon]